MSYSSTVLADSPLAYWRLGDAALSATAADSSVSGTHNATGHAPYTLGSTALLSGDPGTSVLLAGAGYFTDSTVIASPGTGDFAVEFWMKSTDAGSNFAFCSDTVVDAFGMHGGKLSWFHGSYQDGSITINDGASHHCVITRQSGTVTFYVDGNVDTSFSSSVSVDFCTGPSCYLGVYGGSLFFWNGNLQELALYGAALSSGRVTAHHAAGIGGGGDTTPPVVASANVNAAGTTLTITFTEAGSPPVLPASSVTGFTLKAGGVTTGSLTSTAISSTTYTATTGRTILSGETLTLDYAPGNVTDSAGSPNAMLTFSATSVTNNSTQTVSAVITENDLPSNHNGNITVHVIGTLTTYTSSTTWTPSGVSGWSVASKTFVNSTHYTIVLTPPTAATPPAGATGTLTLTEGVTGSTAPTITVGTPTIGLSVTTGATGGTQAETITGTHTIWLAETASGLITLTGGTSASISNPPTVATNTSLSNTITKGSAAGALTIKDTSTGATATFTVTSGSSLSAGILTVTAFTATAISFAWTAATGGTGPYTYQLQRAPDVAGSPGSWWPVDAGTASPFTETPIYPDTKLWYRVVVTDSAAATATSNQVSVTTDPLIILRMTPVANLQRPRVLPANHPGPIPIDLHGKGVSLQATWPTATFTLPSPPTGTTKVSQTFLQPNNTGADARITVATGSGVGILTITDGTISVTIPVATPHLSVTPPTGRVGDVVTVTLGGTATLWAGENPTGLIAMAGGTGASLGTLTVLDDTTVSAPLTLGSAAGPLTFTDTSTGATTTFAVSAWPEVIRADIDSGWSHSAGWTTAGGGLGGIRYQSTSAGLTATFTFTGLAPGNFRFGLGFISDPSLVPNLAWTITPAGGSPVSGTADERVNQPDFFINLGGGQYPYHYLGGAVTLPGTSATLVLTTPSGGIYTFIDSATIQPLGTDHISMASGTWDNTATWDPPSVPGSGDFAVLRHNVTISATDVLIGDGSTANAIDCTYGTLAVTGRKLTIKGNSLWGKFNLTHGVVKLAVSNAGATPGGIEFDGNVGITPLFVMGEDAIFTFTGTSSAHAFLRTKSGTAGNPGRLTNNGPIDTHGTCLGSMQMAYCDIARLGDNGHPGIGGVSIVPLASGTASFTMDHCTVDSCGTTPYVNCNDGSVTLSFTNSHWSNSLTDNDVLYWYGSGQSLGIYVTADITSGTRLVDNCVFEPGGRPGPWRIPQFTISNCYLPDVYQFFFAEYVSYHHGNFIDKINLVPATGVNGNVVDCFILAGAPPGESVGGIMSNAAIVGCQITDNVCQSICTTGGLGVNGFFGQGEGAAGSGFTPTRIFTYLRNIMVPLQNGGGADFAFTISNGSLTPTYYYWHVHTVIEHNTLCSNGNVAPICSGLLNTKPGTCSSLRSNAFYNVGSTGYVFEQLFNYDGGPATADVIANVAGACMADYNSWIGYGLVPAHTWDAILPYPNNLTDGTVYNTPQTIAPGAHDLASTDPGFVDKTRSLQTWDLSLGGAGTIASARARIKANPSLTSSSLNPYIRAGFVTTNGALATAAHDGTTIGAVQVWGGAATSYRLVAPTPSKGDVGVSSAPFVIIPNGTFTGTITITPSGGGLSTPIVLTFTGPATPQTVTLTPTIAGAVITLTPTNSGTLTNPSPVTYLGMVQIGVSGTGDSANFTPHLGGQDLFAAGTWLTEFKRDITGDAVDPSNADVQAMFPGAHLIVDWRASGTGVPVGTGLIGIPFSVVPGDQPLLPITYTVYPAASPPADPNSSDVGNVPLARHLSFENYFNLIAGTVNHGGGYSGGTTTMAVTGFSTFISAPAGSYTGDTFTMASETGSPIHTAVAAVPTLPPGPTTSITFTPALASSVANGDTILMRALYHNYDAPESDTSHIDQHALVAVRNETTGLIDTIWEFETAWTTDRGLTWMAHGGVKFNVGTGAQRPDACSSAEAGGMIMIPALVRYDEVNAAIARDPVNGDIGHVVRATFPYSATNYVWPARHVAGAGSYPSVALGGRHRLSSAWYGTNAASFTGQARIIINSMRKYGIIQTDNNGGGTPVIEGVTDDRWDADATTHGIYALTNIPFSAFELVKYIPGWTHTGPTSGVVGVPYTFTLTRNPAGQANYGANISVGGANYSGPGGSFVGSPVFLTDGSASGTYTFTPTAAGTHTLGGATGGQNWYPPAPITFTAVASNALTLSGPTFGFTGMASANFTVTATTLSGSDTVTPHSTGGTFSPTSLSFSSGSSALTFTFTSTVDGSHSISITDSLGATIFGSPIAYVSTSDLVDTFTRGTFGDLLTGTTSDSGHVWGPTGDNTIALNGAGYAYANGNHSGAWWSYIQRTNWTLGSADYGSEITLGPDYTAAFCGPSIRVSGSNSASQGYTSAVAGGALYLIRGNNELLINGALIPTTSSGDRLRIEGTGTTPVLLTVLLNDGAIASFSDSSPSRIQTTGSAGFVAGTADFTSTPRIIDKITAGPITGIRATDTFTGAGGSAGHTPGGLILTKAWAGGIAPGSSVTFTPSCTAIPGITFTPPTITLTSSGGSTGSCTISIPGSVAAIAYTLRITATGGLATSYASFTVVDPPAAKCVVGSVAPHGALVQLKPQLFGGGATLAITALDLTGGFLTITRGGTPMTPIPTDAMRYAITGGGDPISGFMARLIPPDRRGIARPTLVGAWTTGTPNQSTTFQNFDLADLNPNGTIDFSAVPTDSAVYTLGGYAVGSTVKLYHCWHDVYPGSAYGVGGAATTSAKYHVVGGASPVDVLVDQTVNTTYDENFNRRKGTLICTLVLTGTSWTATLTNQAGTGTLYGTGVFAILQCPPIVLPGDTRARLQLPDNAITTTAGTCGPVDLDLTIETISSPSNPSTAWIPVPVGAPNCAVSFNSGYINANNGQNSFWRNLTKQIAGWAFNSTVDSNGQLATITANMQAEIDYVQGHLSATIAPNTQDGWGLPGTIANRRAKFTVPIGGNPSVYFYAEENPGTPALWYGPVHTNGQSGDNGGNPVVYAGTPPTTPYPTNFPGWGLACKSNGNVSAQDIITGLEIIDGYTNPADTHLTHQIMRDRMAPFTAALTTSGIKPFHRSMKLMGIVDSNIVNWSDQYSSSYIGYNNVKTFLGGAITFFGPTSSGDGSAQLAAAIFPPLVSPPNVSVMCVKVVFAAPHGMITSHAFHGQFVNFDPAGQPDTLGGALDTGGPHPLAVLNSTTVIYQTFSTSPNSGVPNTLAGAMTLPGGAAIYVAVGNGSAPAQDMVIAAKEFGQQHYCATPILATDDYHNSLGQCIATYGQPGLGTGVARSNEVFNTGANEPTYNAVLYRANLLLNTTTSGAQGWAVDDFRQFHHLMNWLRLRQVQAGYTGIPEVRIQGFGTGALAHATVDPTNHQITAIILDAPGSGYTSAPTVTIMGGYGTGATVTATVANVSGVWKVTGFTGLVGGSGYTLTGLNVADIFGIYDCCAADSSWVHALGVVANRYGFHPDWISGAPYLDNAPLTPNGYQSSAGFYEAMTTGDAADHYAMIARETNLYASIQGQLDILSGTYGITGTKYVCYEMGFSRPMPAGASFGEAVRIGGRVLHEPSMKYAIQMWMGRIGSNGASAACYFTNNDPDGLPTLNTWITWLWDGQLNGTGDPAENPTLHDPTTWLSQVGGGLTAFAQGTAPPPATELLITTQPPGSTAVGAPFGLVVKAESAGPVVDTSYTANVTVAIGTNPSSGTLSGTTTVAAVAGVATFAGLSINNPGAGYTLVASSGALTTATSSAFTITASSAFVFNPIGSGTIGCHFIKGM